MAKELREKMRMNIELADNGIIIRNPDDEDDVTLAVEGVSRCDEVNHLEEHRLIGLKIYSWLMDVLLVEHYTDLIITNFDIEITATCKGRARK